MWVVVVLVTAVSVVGCYAPPDFAARLTIVTSCSVAAVVMLTVLVEKTMNHDGGVWRDDKYRRAVTGTGGKLFCMFCPSVFWAEALATGFDICGMDGGGLPCLLAVQQPSKSPHRPKFRSSCQTPRPRWLQLLRRAAIIQLLLLRCRWHPKCPPPLAEVRISPPTLPQQSLRVLPPTPSPEPGSRSPLWPPTQPKSACPLPGGGERGA